MPSSFRKALSVLAAPALLAAVLFNFGSPSLQRVRDDIDRKFGKYSADLVAGKATHFAGGYWDVWPAVFHANLLLYEQQVPRTVWGLTYRGEVTQQDWQNLPPEDVRVAVPADRDRDASSYLAQFGLADSILVERLPTISRFAARGLRPLVRPVRQRATLLRLPGQGRVEQDRFVRITSDLAKRPSSIYPSGHTLRQPGYGGPANARDHHVATGRRQRTLATQESTKDYSAGKLEHPSLVSFPRVRALRRPDTLRSRRALKLDFRRPPSSEIGGAAV